MNSYIKFWITGILPFFALILSCEFEPGEVPESHIQKPSVIPPTITLDITPDTDTLWVNESVIIRYHAITIPRNLILVAFAVDDSVIYQRSWDLQGPIEMTLEIAPYEDGLHTLYMTYITNSNSGSIADKTGNEGYMYVLEWPLVIDRTTEHRLKIFPIVPVNNGVLLEWEGFIHPAFNNYTITKYSDSYHQSKTLAIITDPGITHFIDSTYLEGEKAHYTVGLNWQFGSQSDYSEMPEPPDVSQTGPFSVKISWKKTRNPAMLGYYLLYANQLYPLPIEDIVVTDADSTSRELNNISFGRDYIFSIQYIPKAYTYSVPTNWINYAEKSFALGDSMESHDISRGIPGGNDILLIKGNQVNNYNIVTGESMPFLNVDFDIAWAINVTPDGNHFGYSSHEEFILRNITTNDIVYTVQYPAFSSYRLVMYTLSSNFRMLAGYEDGRMIIYDLPTGQVEAEFNYGSRVYAKISPDGNHVMMRDYNNPTNQIYFEVVDSTFVEIANTQENNALQRSFTFSPDNRLFLFYTGRVEIRNALDYSIINQYDLPAGYIDAWDFDNNQILAYDYYTNTGYVMDINTGMLMKTIKMYSGEFINLKSNFVTTGLGRKLNLDFISGQRASGMHKHKILTQPISKMMLK